MTEREILKKLVEAWHQSANAPSTADWPKLFFEAGKLLAQSEPAPEHPAVEAYRKWCNSLNPRAYAMSEGFLAGWRQALAHIAGNFDEHSQSHRHLVAASNATPEHLP